MKDAYPKRERQFSKLTEEQIRKIDELLEGASGLSLDNRGSFNLASGVFYIAGKPRSAGLKVRLGTQDKRVFTIVSQAVLRADTKGSLAFIEKKTNKVRILTGVIRQWRSGKREGDVEGTVYISQFAVTED